MSPASQLPEGTAVPDPLAPPDPIGYQDYPPLTEFLSGNGIPGITYLFTSSQHIMEAQNKGYSLVKDVNPFLVQGVPTQLMAMGRRASSAADSAALPEVFVQLALDKLTGLGKPAESAATAATTQKATKAS